MLHRLAISAVACTLALSTAAQSALVDFVGEVGFDGPTFDRPFVDGEDLGPSNRDVSFEAKDFTVDEDGTYVITTETLFLDQTIFWDGALLIYADAFDPLDSETNLIAYEGVGGGTFDPSQVSVLLETERLYVLVQSGVSSFDFGPYAGTAVGPGEVMFPEPTTVLICPAALLLLRRRR
ncbi:MAG: hypothetical protein AAF561_04595 [Planctomycetota bacterium]